jgi:hypothetical protein
MFIMMMIMMMIMIMMIISAYRLSVRKDGSVEALEALLHDGLPHVLVHIGVRRRRLEDMIEAVLCHLPNRHNSKTNVTHSSQ